jgi:hypothetical protein
MLLLTGSKLYDGPNIPEKYPCGHLGWAHATDIKKIENKGLLSVSDFHLAFCCGQK